MCLIYRGLFIFSDLKSINYPLKYLVCDDNNNIKLAAIDIYPDVVIQTCTKHFLESIRDTLNTKTCNKYLPFVIDVESIFTLRLASWELVWKIQDIYNKYNNDPKTMFWMSEIIRRKEELTNYHMFIDAPNTTNLIEVYNSHLEGRLKTIKGFESFHSARRWLNAYIIKRRLSEFTECGKKFKHLNGHKSLEKTLKNNQKLPDFF